MMNSLSFLHYVLGKNTRKPTTILFLEKGLELNIATTSVIHSVDELFLRMYGFL